jgi:hypothetical protein
VYVPLVRLELTFSFPLYDYSFEDSSNTDVFILFNLDFLKNLDLYFFISWISSFKHWFNKLSVSLITKDLEQFDELSPECAVSNPIIQ